MVAFRQIALFCLEKRLSKHKMTTFSENFWGGMALLPLPGYAYYAYALGPPWRPRSSSLGHERRQMPKLGIFIDEQGGTSVESLLKGAMAHESLRSTVLSDTDKSC